MTALSAMLPTRVDAVEVVPGLLIGSAPSPRAVKVLARRGVTHVLDLRCPNEGLDGEWPAAVTVRREPVFDGARPSAEQLGALVAWVADVIDGRGRVLVHCRVGVGRAVTVGLAVLVHRGMPLPQAWDLVHQMRPTAAPTDAQVAALLEYAAQLSRGATPATTAR